MAITTCQLLLEFTIPALKREEKRDSMAHTDGRQP